MVRIVLLATGWGSKHGGINVVNMELTLALAEVLGSDGRVYCVVPHAEEKDVEDVEKSGAKLISLQLSPHSLPDRFDPGWVGTAEKRLADVGAGNVDWCIGHDAISGAAANLMKRNARARASAVISHMSYVDYQGVKHEEIANTEHKIQEQNRILMDADCVIAVGPLLGSRAADVVDRDVPNFIPGLSKINPRPSRKQFVGISFGRFERVNDRIKQIQLVAEGFAEARKQANQPGGPQLLCDNPLLKLIGVADSDQEARDLKRAMKQRAGQIVVLRPMPYKEDRQRLYDEIAGSSVALMLSWHEGFGLTGWEAIAAEVPLIVTKQSGLHRLLCDEGVAGLAYEVSVDGSYGDDDSPNFSERDCDAVAKRILDIAGNPAGARKRAANLKKYLVDKGFTWSMAARTVLKALGITPPTGGVSEPDVRQDGGPRATESASEVTLASYLSRLREVVGVVVLAGDSQARPIQDVYVEVEVSRGGILEDSEPDHEPDHNLISELRTELSRRMTAPWRQVTETIPAIDLLDFAHRTLILGAAGTGKSTLLRWLAVEAATRRESDENARIPIWLPRLPPHHDLEKDISTALAKLALSRLDLDDGPSSAMQAIRSALEQGNVLILIDGVDESGMVEQGHAETWLEKLDGRVVLASRPLIEGKLARDIATVTLHGIPGIVAEQLLRKYFPGEDWVDAFLEELRALPDGQIWLETPVLLGLAATLYRADRALPRSTIDLYRRAVTHLLASERLPPKFRGGTLRGELQTFARDHLLSAIDAPKVVFESGELPFDRLELYKQTGLFEGGSRFRFSHLTLGEFLAAESDVCLESERAKLVAKQGQLPEGTSLEVVPMAHAIQGATALQAALVDASARDLSDHRLLRLVLRALGYGGKGVGIPSATHTPSMAW